MELAGREAWEVRAFFGLWLLALLHAGVRPARQAWVEQLGLAALLCMGQVAFGGLDDALRLGVAAGALALGALLGLVALRVQRAQPATRKVGAGRRLEVGA